VKAVSKAQFIDMETGTAGNQLLLLLPPLLLFDLARGGRDMIGGPRVLIDGHDGVVPILIVLGRMAEPGNLSYGGCCPVVSSVAVTAAVMALKRGNGVSLKKGNVFLRVLAVVAAGTVVGAQCNNSSTHWPCAYRSLVVCWRGKPGPEKIMGRRYSSN
jgi:hypothetical protein